MTSLKLRGTKTSCLLFLAAAFYTAVVRSLVTNSKSADRATILEVVWRKKIQRHETYVDERKEYLQSAYTRFAGMQEVKAYDPFEPEWVCEDEERLGKRTYSIGDGPKFVCAARVLRSFPRCIVYSIGSDWDFSFEKAVHERAPNCEIHTFDGTMDLSKRALPLDLESNNIHFHNWNIISKSQTCSSNSCETYESTKGALGHHGLDVTVLKIDCEFCEHVVLPEILQVDRKLAQVLIEVHGADHEMILSLFTTMFQSGLMIFHKERNHWGCSGWRCVEFSLISQSFARRALDEFLS